MQPKCSQSNTSSTTNTNSPSVSSTSSQLLVPVERFKEICLKNSGKLMNFTEFSNELNSVLDYFFDPDKDFYKFLTDFDLFKLYLSGGIGLDSFKNKIKAYDNSSVCGLVWNVNYVAYRCRTCALSPCMSICADCFRNGDHKGHDFNMFRSGAGGACDCGDECVMNPKGFCKSHGSHSCKASNSNSIPPEDLIVCCELMLPSLLYRLLQYFRNVYSSTDFTLISRSQTNHMLNDIQVYLEFLNELCSTGTPIRKILVDYMISDEFYDKKIQTETKKSQLNTSTLSFSQKTDKSNETNVVEEDESDPNSAIMATVSLKQTNYKQEVYLKSLKSQQKIKVPSRFENIADEICLLTSNTMLGEFLFWCIKFEFPETLVKYLLSLLPDLRYKQMFIKSFVSQYSYISILLLNSKSEHLASRVVHISVQLFSNEAIAMKALDESNLLPIILSTLYNMIVTPYNQEDEDKLLINCKSENEAQNKHKVIDPDHPIMQENLYWLVISDLVNLLSHKAVALVFLNDENLVEIWFELISYFQVMNLNVRKFGEHVIQEQPTYFSSFSAELEFCSSVLWSFLQHLKNPNQLSLSKKLINLLLKNLKKWLISIDLNSEHLNQIKRPNPKHLTFHLPLHRYYAAFIYNSIYEQSASLDYLLPKLDTNLLADLLAYPLQLQIGFHEIHANMWVRNGMQMKGQAMTYVQNHFCTSFSDADLFLIQLLSSRIDPSTFMALFFERFHLIKWLKTTVKNRHKTNNQTTDSETIVASVVEEMLDEFESTTPQGASTNPTANTLPNEEEQDYLDPAHQVAMLVGSLTVLAQIITIKPNLSFKSYSLTRTEVVNLLCVLDRTYSQIDDSMPDVCSLSQAKRFIPSILNDVAEFLQPSLDISSIGNLKQGRYKPKDSIWLTEYDPLYTMLRSVKRREFQESFDRYCQFVERKFSNKKVPKNLWPPFRLPKIASQSDIQELASNIKEEEEETNPSSYLSYSIKERFNQLRIDHELFMKSRLLNTKTLHAILITILYEHYYTNPVSEKVLYFTIYILELALHLSPSNDCGKQNDSMDTEEEAKRSPKVSFDELNYETWFKSNEIKRNLCTFVPFLSSKYEPINPLEQEEENTKGRFKTPPMKRICSRSGDTNTLNDASSGDDENNDASNTSPINDSKVIKRITNPKTGEIFQLKKTKTFESILSLLVKIYFKNMNSTSDEKSSESNIVNLKFLSPKSSVSNDEFQFSTNRIGNENDFIYNLLEKAAISCEKCRLNIEKSLETLNNVNIKKVDLTTTQMTSNLAMTSNEQTATTSNDIAMSSSPSSVESELLKNKKLKAKARQQRILAQMSNSQQAFLSNPINKLDVDAFKESTGHLTSPGSTLTSTLNELTNQFKAIKQQETEPSDIANPATTSTNSREAENSEEYECCICRLSAASNLDRPLGAVTLLQSTSVLGHRESIKINIENRKLPLSDDVSYKQLQTETMCWKQEEKRVKTLREAFSLDSCKYSINIGWKGGIYSQMCGHFLHFDCYNSYKKTLDEHLSRVSNVEYSCPLCRQVANCVLPIITLSKQAATSSSTNHSPPFSLTHSTLSNTPAKLWILSSLADKQKQIEEILSQDQEEDSKLSIEQLAPINKLTSLTEQEMLNKQILNLLKTRPFSTPEFSSKTLTQCKNDALAIITLTTPLEFRYIDQWTSLSSPSSASPIDDDIAMFTSSVLRTQLEIDLMLKQIEDLYTSTNLKKRRSCFLPLYDVISTHCRLMCHEMKPHVRLWLMLTNPALLAEEISSQFIKIKLRQFEQTDIKASSQISSIDSADNANEDLFTKNKIHKPAVPTLLKDPIACLLLVIVNLPTNVPKTIFTNVVQSLFNMVFVQNILYLCREFDEHERKNWSNHNNNCNRWISFKDYVANVINILKKTSILIGQKNGVGNNSNKNVYFVQTIWSLESAKNYVKLKCLHFLKIASLLQYYLYDNDIQFNQLNSFDYLIKNLNINYNDDGQQPLLKWCLPNAFEIINVWLDELITANENHHQQIDALYSIIFDEYHFPTLLELPYLYSDLFGYYSTKKCQFCSKIPKETGICLLCGVQFCYKNHYCCDSMKEFNKKHLNFCGAQTLVLLNINSTYVFVIRGKRCAPWASLYLDEHGEEDRDLRRGKPLYLNKQRYSLLQSTWRNHSFDYQSLKWYNASLFIY